LGNSNFLEVDLEKTFLINDLVWIGFASAVCCSGLKLGSAPSSNPTPGSCLFFRVLLGLLACSIWSPASPKAGGMKKDAEIWADIHWGKLLLTWLSFHLHCPFHQPGVRDYHHPPSVLFFRAMERRPLWVVAVSSVTCTGLFYLAFKIDGESAARGILGFLG
jgi:hypothetical protein